MATVQIQVRVNGSNQVGLDKQVKPVEDDVIYDVMALRSIQSLRLRPKRRL